MDIKLSDGTESEYATPPVEVAYLKWTRGNAQLGALLKTDPAAYLGGWSAFVKRLDDPDVALPALPLPIVRRVSQDGRHPYEVYATNAVNFLPIRARTRFELRRKEKKADGSEIERVVAVSRKRIEGYTPYRQIFGLVYPPDMAGDPAPAVLKVFKWSAFISFENAGRKWNAVKAPEGKALVRRYGTIGEVRGGLVVPKFETIGKAQFTPIEAINIDDPIFVDITDQIVELYEKSEPWASCERWHSSAEEKPASGLEAEFMARCRELRLTDEEIRELLRENGGDYEAALAALTGDAINAALEATDNPFD